MQILPYWEDVQLTLSLPHEKTSYPSSSHLI